MTPVLEITDLTRKYGDRVAVDSISMTVERGSLFAFLGPNGAGKSTTISALTTISPAQGGQCTYSFEEGAKQLILGRDDAAIRSQIGVVFQDSLLDSHLSVRANLEMRASFYDGIETPKVAVGRVTELLSLGEISRQQYGTLSGGQRRRVDIARGLLNRPAVLFLDEPTTGLDPQSRNMVWESIHSMVDAGNITIFLTTHYMEEAENADQVQVIDHGKLIAHGTPTQLRATYAKSHFRMPATSRVIEALQRHAIPFSASADVVEAEVSDAAKAAAFVVAEGIDDFEFVHGSMDDVFLALTGTELRGE